MYDKGKYIASSDNAFVGGCWQGAKAAFAPPPLASRVRHCGERNYFIHITLYPLPPATRLCIVYVYTRTASPSRKRTSWYLWYVQFWIVKRLPSVHLYTYCLIYIICVRVCVCVCVCVLCVHIKSIMYSRVADEKKIN